MEQITDQERTTKMTRSRSARPQWEEELFIDDVTLGEYLGGGNFGSVFKGLWGGITEVALKTVSSASDTQSEDFMKEVAILRSVKHPNVVQYYGLVEIENIQYMVMEYANLGSLQSFLKTTLSSPLSMIQVASIAKDIAAGMNYLATAKIVHRDLAARNILIKQSGNVIRAIVTDFGLSNKNKGKITAKDVTHGGGLAVRWAAPELLNDKPLFSTKSDVWAYGVVLWELFNPGQNPYPSMSNEEVMNKVQQYYTLPSMPEDICPPWAALIMTSCFSYDPEDRLTFKAISAQLENFIRKHQHDNNNNNN